MSKVERACVEAQDLVVKMDDWPKIKGCFTRYKDSGGLLRY